MPTALVIGSSSGIGLALCHRLVAAGWDVVGGARRPDAVGHPRYRHLALDVRAPAFGAALADELATSGVPEVCVYAAGVGRELVPEAPAGEADTIATNLLGAAVTAEVVLPAMLAAGRGHLVGLSSLADRLRDGGAPAYAASKAGLSSLYEGLALAYRPRGVAVTNVRLGFVDTPMSATVAVRPFLLTADQAAAIVERALARRPIRVSRPRPMVALAWLAGLPGRLRAWAT